MEQDPARIEQVLAALQKVWEEFPDLRLGQLLVNAIRPSQPCPELFSVEDTVLVRMLERLAYALRRVKAGPGPDTE